MHDHRTMREPSEAEILQGISERVRACAADLEDAGYRQRSTDLFEAADLVAVPATRLDDNDLIAMLETNAESAYVLVDMQMVPFGDELRKAAARLRACRAVRATANSVVVEALTAALERAEDAGRNNRGLPQAALDHADAAALRAHLAAMDVASLDAPHSTSEPEGDLGRAWLVETRDAAGTQFRGIAHAVKEPREHNPDPKSHDSCLRAECGAWIWWFKEFPGALPAGIRRCLHCVRLTRTGLPRRGGDLRAVGRRHSGHSSSAQSLATADRD